MSEFKVSQISSSPFIEVKLKQGSVSKNLVTLSVHSLEIGLYSLYTASQDMESRIQDTGYRSQDTVT